MDCLATVADQGFRVGEEGKPGFLPVPPGSPSDQIGPENLPFSEDAEAADSPPGADLIVDLLRGIETLTKDDARARFLELEENQEETFFEIGGVLSAIRKRKWFDPYGSLDEWVEKNTAIKRSRARALIRIYDGVAKSGVTLAKVKHLGWTKLNALVGVLEDEHADRWIEMASNHSRAEIKKLVQEHLVGSAGRKPAESTPTRVKTYKFHVQDDRHVEAVDAAFDAAKKVKGLSNSSDAFAHICACYMRLQWRKGGTDQMPDGLACVFVDLVNKLDENAAREIMKAVHASLTHDLKTRVRD
jgi:hypothetical protein